MTKIPDSEAETGADVTIAPGGPGPRLRASREARNLSIAEVSSRLRLDAPTLSALENNDFQGLPAPIFVRGYLRNYARLLGMDESEVVAEYDAQGVPEPRPTLNAISRGRIGAGGFPWRLVGWALLLALAAAGVVMYGPQMGKLWSAANKTEAPAGSLTLPGAEPEGQGPEKAVPAQPAAPAQPPPAEQAEPASPPPAVAPESSTGPAEAPSAAPGQGTAPAASDQAVTSGEPAPSAGQADTAPGGQAEAQGDTLTLKFQGDCWTEVRDATGKRLLFGLIHGGEQKSLGGRPPFSVVLGNSQAVSITYDGKSFDQSRYNQGNVARFQVGEAPHGQ